VLKNLLRIFYGFLFLLQKVPILEVESGFFSVWLIAY
jgi:hypothetical protein